MAEKMRADVMQSIQVHTHTHTHTHTLRYLHTYTLCNPISVCTLTPPLPCGFLQDYLSTQLQLIVESSTPKVLRSRDKEGGQLGWCIAHVTRCGLKVGEVTLTTRRSSRP